ncbi:MAG: hypothetical protein KDC09_16350 [Bacteroidales bacterium]|nr:hypothetical protein [Bacteroidales bacterium]
MTALTQIIKEKINESGQTVHQFAKQLGMSSSGLYRLLNRKDMPLSRFLHISRLLNYNLLTELYPGLAPHATVNNLLQTENQQLKQQVTNLTADKKLLSDVINLLKDKTII